MLVLRTSFLLQARQYFVGFLLGGFGWFLMDSVVRWFGGTVVAIWTGGAARKVSPSAGWH